MANKTPALGQSIEQVEISPLEDSDATPAVVDHLQDIDRRQWQLLTRFGSPDYFACVDFIDGGVTWNGSSYDKDVSTYVFQVQVPPTIDTADVVILASGAGRFKSTTDTDSTGTQLDFSNNNTAPIDMATEFGSCGPLPTSEGAASTRAIQVATADRARWQSCTCTVTLVRIGETSYVNGVILSKPGRVYGIGFRWHWKPVESTDSDTV